MLKNTNASTRTRKGQEALDSWTFDGQCFGAPPPFRADAWLDEYKRTALEKSAWHRLLPLQPGRRRPPCPAGGDAKAAPMRPSPFRKTPTALCSGCNWPPARSPGVYRFDEPQQHAAGRHQYCFPRAATSPISLQLVMVDGRQALETGGLVKIITEESAVGPEDCSGRLAHQRFLYYYYDGYAPPGKAGCWKKPTAARA